VASAARIAAQNPDAEKRGSNTARQPASEACAKVLSALM
jgi:hypothetical protein